MRRHVKNVHLSAIALERGGWANLKPQDYGRAGQIIREQYGYLKRFAGQIASGEQKLDGTLVRRATMYSQIARRSYYQSKRANMRPDVTHVRTRRSARDSCRQCLELDMKIFRADDASFPLPGNRICRANCRCHLEYLSLSDSEEYQVVESV